MSTSSPVGTISVQKINNMIDKQKLLSDYMKWSKGRTREECTRVYTCLRRLLLIIDEEQSPDEYTEWNNYKKYVKEERLLHKLVAIDNERRMRLKESPNSEKEIATWYCNQLIELHDYKDEYVKKIKSQYYKDFGEELIITKYEK